MIENKIDYNIAKEELKDIIARFVKFNEQQLLKRGYPTWLVKGEKEHLTETKKQLEIDISAFEQSNPVIKSSHNLSKRKRFRNRKRNK